MPYRALLLPAACLSLLACGQDDSPRVEDGELLVPEDTEVAVPTDVDTPVVGPADAAAAPPPLALTALDCGRIEVGALGLFSDEGTYDGQTDTFADTCWVVEHPDGVLLWDLGVPAGLTESGPVTNGPFTVSLARTLEDQLAERGLTPDFVAISHSHFDHTGQPEAAEGAVFLAAAAERAFMAENPAQDGATPFDALLGMDTVTYEGERDVFGDGRVRILEMPGHTPGHSVLLVDLEEEGPVLLTGDMYHLDRARELRTVPTFNWDADTTRQSMDAFETLATETGARVIIQHEDADVTDLLGRTLR